ncbi:MAG: hypothetical protein ABFS42_10750 [Candidatus Krumholzibacteriota bacterium]
MAEAHVGMVPDPSRPGEVGCNATGCHSAEPFASACSSSDCHPTHAENWTSSLHANLQGEVNAVEGRCAIDLDQSGFRPSFNNQCAQCHATCGQCHVSRPNSSGGGFVYLEGATVSRSHLFQSKPHMTEQCTACHGTRIATDYLKQGDGIPETNVEDIHWRLLSFTCIDCHSGNELHGNGQVLDHRYEVAEMPRCEKCHSSLEPGNDFHDFHVGVEGRDLQCQICHSQPYRNCTGCHNTVDGTVYDEEFNLKIARNDPTAFPYRQDNPYRPDNKGYDFVLVRHVPVARNTYEHWGLVDMPNYTGKPTWLYTSPHNIVKNTPRAADCGSCHDSDFYLKTSDLTTPDERTANAGIVMD